MSLNHHHSLKLSFIAIACAIFMIGCATSSKKIPVTPNPFSADGSGHSTNLQINTLKAFGDSYTSNDYANAFGVQNWPLILGSLIPIKKIENYAVGGARAQDAGGSPFPSQIARSSSATSQDLSVVYFGYNDISRVGRSEDSYAASRAAYSAGVNRLVSMGAARGYNRIFVTQIHDWSRNPGVDSAATKDAVRSWNNHVASVANTNSNIIAVDLFTVFERVMDNPAQFGLVNVTNDNSARSGSDYLFHDDIHFGSRGQTLIARTYHHYLTRGWDWANALNAGGSASGQLRNDVANGALSFNGGRSINNNMRFIPIIAQGSKPVLSGLAFDAKTQPLFGLDSGRVGFAHGYTEKKTLQTSNLGSLNKTDIQSASTALYWMQPSGGFFYTAEVSQNRHQFEQNAHDNILRNSIQNRRSANTVGFEGAVRYTFGLGSTSITPWVSFSQEQHTLHASTDRSLYTTNVSYRPSKVSDTYSGIGLDFEVSKMPLRGGHSLVMGGGINHLRALQRDALRLQSSEAINGIVSTEVFERGFEPRTQLSLNADLVLKQQYQLGLTYRVEPEQRRTSQALELKAKIPF
jgi:hypothetical protein